MGAAMTWVLVGNASEAKLYESQNFGKELNLVKTYHHEQSRAKSNGSLSDRGRFKTNNGIGQGSFMSASDPKTNEIKKFARQLAQDLDHGRTANRFDRLVVIMPPHAHGILNKACNDHVLNKVIHHIEKDYTKMQDRQLLAYLDDLARY